MGIFWSLMLSKTASEFSNAMPTSN